MTREHAKELLPIIQAFANGEVIQGQYNNGKWMDATDNATFSPDCKWRIKPKPREWWICVNNEMDPSHDSSSPVICSCQQILANHRTQIRVREILD